MSNKKDFQSNWIKKNIDNKSGLRSLQQSSAQKSNYKVLQKGHTTLEKPKGQKDISYFSAVLQQKLKFKEINISTPPCDREFSELLEEIEQNIESKSQILNEIQYKKQEADNQTSELQKRGENYKFQALNRVAKLGQSSFNLFKKGFSAIDNKIEILGNFEEEDKKAKFYINVYDQDAHKVNLEQNENLYQKFEDVKKLNPNHNVANYQGLPNPRRAHQGMSNMEIEERYPPHHIHIENRMKNHSPFQAHHQNIQNTMNDQQQAQAFEENIEEENKYSSEQINKFCMEIDKEAPQLAFKAKDSLSQIFMQLCERIQTDVKTPIDQKGQSLQKLIQQSAEKTSNFFMDLPINHFKIKGEQILQKFQLPPYDKFRSFKLQNLPVKIEAFSISLLADDLKRLQMDELINDNLLDCYAQYLRFRNNFMASKNSQPGKKGDIYIFSHLFFETQYDGVRIKHDEARNFISKMVSIDQLLDPQYFDRFGFIINVNLHSIKHWIFFGVFNETRKIVYYDSAASNSAYFKPISTSLVNFFQYISNISYSVEKQDNCPKQENGTDCGMFVMKFIQNFAYGSPQQFSQSNVTSLRKKLHTFFPLLSSQLTNHQLDFDLLSYFEDRFQPLSDLASDQLYQSLRQV